jgi:2'-5' RNA ligase
MVEPAPGETAPSARLFFGLWPDAGVARQLMQLGNQLHARLGGKLAREASVHMTLAFLGQVAAERVDGLARAASALPFEPFALRMVQVGCWPHNGVGWVAPTDPPPALTRLVSALQSALLAQGFPPEERSFAPHVTLIRKARCTRLDPVVPQIEWQVNDFVLVRSQLNRAGSNYTIIARWPQEKT